MAIRRAEDDASWWARTMACSPSPRALRRGGRGDGRWRARRCAWSRSRRPSTGATSSPPWRPTSRPERRSRGPASRWDPDELVRFELPRPQTEDGALWRTRSRSTLRQRHARRRARGARDVRAAARPADARRRCAGALRVDLRRRRARRAARLRGRLPHAGARREPRHRRPAARPEADAELRIARGVSAPLGAPRPASARRARRTTAPASSRARRAARHARHGWRAVRRPRAPGQDVDRPGRARAADVLVAARPAAACCRSRAALAVAEACGERATSSGPTTCCSTGARSPGSSPRAAPRKAGRCSGSA